MTPIGTSVTLTPDQQTDSIIGAAMEAHRHCRDPIQSAQSAGKQSLSAG
jgi:hypothetical protein